MSLPLPPPFPLPHPGPWLASDITTRLGSGRAAASLCAGGLLLRITYGGYFEARAWAELSDDDRHRAVLGAFHAYQSRRGGVRYRFSHLSAARLHGLDLWKPDSHIHIVTPASVARGQRRADLLVHAGTVPLGQQCEIGGLPVTSLERTMVDSARILRPGQAQIVMDHGLRVGARRELLQRQIDEGTGGRGILTARRALELGSDKSESAAESLRNFLLAGMGVPKPQQQIRVETRFGRHRIDTGWPAIRRGIEVDGTEKYFAYAPTEEVIFRERQREKALMEDDWRFLRIGWSDLFRPAELEMRVVKLLASAGPAGLALLREGRSHRPS